MSDEQPRYEALRKLLHLIAGGLGATAGQVVTCPLDVVQTRLQSTHLNFSNIQAYNSVVGAAGGQLQIGRPVFGFSYFQILFNYMRFMVHTEGIKSLFKGLSPGLFGIVPAKATYFFCYANAKTELSKIPTFKNHQHVVHTLSAVLAGSITGTVTNPVWYIKTKLQLDKSHRPSVFQVIKRGYQKHGMKCFFRGVSASYVGVLETVIYFLMYEEMKQSLKINTDRRKGEKFQAVNLIFAAMSSKCTATMLMYPHEVIRVRLRQDLKDPTGQLKYRNFFQAFMTVFREEGRAGLYGGFATSLMRQLPNTAVTFLTYELIVYLLEND